MAFFNSCQKKYNASFSTINLVLVSLSESIMFFMR